MNKMERDGKVAVLYSPGFGAGWVSWAEDRHKDLLAFDADIVQAVLDGDRSKAAALAVEKCGEDSLCTIGADQLEVMWLEKGTLFEINEYDGKESVHVIGSRGYMKA